MNWKSILCGIFGHKLHPVEVHYADKKTRHFYDCSRCGQRFSYQSVYDRAVQQLLEIEITKKWFRMQRYHRCPNKTIK
jgi:hypothetical protein